MTDELEGLYDQQHQERQTNADAPIVICRAGCDGTGWVLATTADGRIYAARCICQDQQDAEAAEAKHKRGCACTLCHYSPRLRRELRNGGIYSDKRREDQRLPRPTADEVRSHPNGRV